MVKDASGNGIQGVDIKVDKKVIGKTDDQGKLESDIKYMLDEVITIEASKEGFRTGLVTNKVRGLTDGESSEIVIELKFKVTNLMKFFDKSSRNASAPIYINHAENI